MTENTLQLVRLTNASQALQRDWESMEEIVGAVLARVRQQDPARRIKSIVPNDLPLIKADPVLLAQLIGNLLDNALKYSHDAIELEVQVAGVAMQVCVKDRGTAIEEKDHEIIFQPCARNDQSGQRSAGLGWPGVARQRLTLLLLRQKKVSKEKATLASATLRCATGTLRCSVQPGSAQIRLALRQGAALIRLALRSSAQTEGGWGNSGKEKEPAQD